MRVIGLMSGTSLDGIDAAMIEIDGDATQVRWSLRAHCEVPYTAAQRATIHAAIISGDAASLCEVHAALGEWLADAALRVCADAGIAPDSVDAIGSHGQTIWHIPPHDSARGATLQLGCPATIAERTGIAVVSDFRSRDVAAGGHGAPLVPWADRLLFAHPDHGRILVNIGGMANLTWVPAQASNARVLAFDTGPGNVLIDTAVDMATDGAQTFDVDGGIARAGTVDEPLLAALLDHEFFRIPPPRSTGREIFGRAFVEHLVTAGGDADSAGARDDRARDAEVRASARALVPTLTELTARSIAESIERWVGDRDFGEVIVTGGGARNAWLMERLTKLLAPAPVRTGTDVGIQSDAKEAIVFGALAWAHINRIPGNLPAATGASGPRILGSFTPGARDTRPGAH